MDTKVFPGTVVITRQSSNTRADVIVIELNDESSHTRCAEIRIPVEAFAYALTATQTDCEFWLAPDNVGLVHEHKQEWVPLPQNGSMYNEDPAPYLAPFEVDGWVGRKSDWGNHHRISSDRKSVRVSFVRWVQPTEEK